MKDSIIANRRTELELILQEITRTFQVLNQLSHLFLSIRAAIFWHWMLLKMDGIVSFFHIVTQFILTKKKEIIFIKIIFIKSGTFHSSIFIDELKQKPKFRTVPSHNGTKNGLHLLALFGCVTNFAWKKKRKENCLKLKRREPGRSVFWMSCVFHVFKKPSINECEKENNNIGRMMQTELNIYRVLIYLLFLLTIILTRVL